MPRTRTEHTREEKRREIVVAAERRLRAGGWDALSMAGMARELGVAQNAVYWYFPSRDHLFVAALQRMTSEIVVRQPSAGRRDVERILWFCEQYADVL